MSQRSAPKAAAKATAVVSDPPRPSVVIRPSGLNSEPGDHGHPLMPSANLRSMFSRGTLTKRAADRAEWC